MFPGAVELLLLVGAVLFLLRVMTHGDTYESKSKPVVIKSGCPDCNCHCDCTCPPPAPPPLDPEYEWHLQGLNRVGSLRRTKWYSHDNDGILYPDDDAPKYESLHVNYGKTVLSEFEDDEDEDEDDDEDDAPIFPFDIVLSTEYTPPRCDYTPPEMLPCAFHCGCDNVPIDWNDIEEPEEEDDNELKDDAPLRVELTMKYVDCPDSAQAEIIDLFPGRMAPYYLNTEYQLPEDYVGPTYDSTGPRDNEQDKKH